MNYHVLNGPAQLPDVKTYSIDQLRDITGVQSVITMPRFVPAAYWNQLSRSLCPWSDAFPEPRNALERDNGYKTLSGVQKVDWGPDRRVTWVEWSGKTVYFHNPVIYLQTLALCTDIFKYIEILKYSPLACFDKRTPPNLFFGDRMETFPKFNPANFGRTYLCYEGEDRHPSRKWLVGAESYQRPAPYGSDPRYVVQTHSSPMPSDVYDRWWTELITYELLQTSFFLLKSSMIEDATDLEDVYNQSGKLLENIKAELETPIVVDIRPAQGLPSELADDWKIGPGWKVSLDLASWEKSRLLQAVDRVRHLIDESRKKVAKRVVQLQTIDSIIAPTSFSIDPAQNPYLVYNPEKSDAAKTPIFTNVARNASATFKPDDVIGKKEDYQYWQKVPEFEQSRARIYATPQGPMSVADMRKYGLTREKTNWVPWLAAGAAAAYAASELL